MRDACRDAGSAFFLKQLGKNPVFKGNPLKLVDQHGGDWNEWPEAGWKIRDITAGFRELACVSESLQNPWQCSKSVNVTKPGTTVRLTPTRR